MESIPEVGGRIERQIAFDVQFGLLAFQIGDEQGMEPAHGITGEVDFGRVDFRAFTDIGKET